MFVGSAIKTFALCEALRQADSPDVVARITNRQLALDASVWNVDSQTFNPPYLSGRVSQRTALEAMICHSDNTATDMIFRAVGVGNIRRFIASAGLTRTEVPDSTRSFFGYILGAEDYRSYSWDEISSSDGVFVRPPLTRWRRWHPPVDGRRDLADPAAAGSEGVHEGREHRHARLSRRLRARWDVLRRSLGVLHAGHQLAIPRRE